MFKVLLLIYALTTMEGGEKCGFCAWVGGCSPTCDHCTCLNCDCEPRASVSVSGPDKEGNITVSGSGTGCPPAEICGGGPPHAGVSVGGAGGGCSAGGSQSASCSYEVNVCGLSPGEYTVHATTGGDPRCCCRCEDHTVAKEKFTVKGDPVVYIHHQEWTSLLNPSGKKIKINDFNPENLEGDTAKANEVTTDELFNIIEDGYTFDANGNLVPYHYVTKFDYNCAHKVTKIVDPRGNETRFSYEPYTDKLLSMTDALGHTTYYQNHDANKNPGRIIDINGNATDFTYDSQGRVLSIAQLGAGPNNTDLITEFHYSGDNLDWVKLPKGNVIDYNYDANNRLTSIVRRVGPTQASQAIESIVYQYDTNGNRIREEYRQGDITGAVKRFTDFGYTDTQIAGAYRLWKVFNPNDPSKFTEFFYDSRGNRTKTIDDALNVTEYLPDNLDRLIKVTQWLTETQPAITEYQYNQNDDLTQVKDAEGHITNYIYDDMGRLVKAESPDTGVTRYWYDPNGNLIGKVDAEGTRIEYSYDALNRLTEIIDTTNPANPLRLVTYYYDGANPHGITVSNGIGRLTGMSDSSGMVSWSYDKRGNVVEERRSVGGHEFVTRYEWDANGNILRVIYPDARVVEYIYSTTDLDRVAELTTTVNGVTTSVARDIQYEPFGDVRGLVYGNGITEAIFRDYRGQITRILLTNGATTIFDRNYTIDPVGNILGWNEAQSGGTSQSFTYDVMNRILTASGPYGDITWSYDLTGNRETQITPTKSFEEYFYQGNRLISKSDPPSKLKLPPGQVESKYRHALNDMRDIVKDSEGNRFIIVVSELMKPLSDFFTETGVNPQPYFDEIKADSEISGIIEGLMQRYQREGRFAIVTRDDVKLMKDLITQLEQHNIIQIAGLSRDTAYFYDANGNIVSDGSATLSYDILGRLTEITTTTPEGTTVPVAIYSYDGQGRRVKKLTQAEHTIFIFDIFGNLISEWDADLNVVIREYAYLGSRPIAMFALPAEAGIPGFPGCPRPSCGVSVQDRLDPLNAFIFFSPLWLIIILRAQNGKRLKRVMLVILLGTSSAVLTSRIATSQVQGEVIYYYHVDHLSTPIMLTDKDANTVWSATFSPFMGIYEQTGNVTQPLRYPGQYADSETGLFYNMNRYYVPSLGRYIQPDIINIATISLSFDVLIGPRQRHHMPEGMDEVFVIRPQFHHPYLYVVNTPLRWVDPLGIAGATSAQRNPDPSPEGCRQCSERIFNEVSDRYPARNDGTSPGNNFMRHCVASCEITKQCPFGRVCAFTGGWWNEIRYRFERNGEDLGANREGRGCGGKDKPCDNCCNAKLTCQ